MQALDGTPLIKPIEFSVVDEDGITRNYILSKFDAVAGREITAKYITSSFPKIGDYAVSEEMMVKLMGYVAVKIGEGVNEKIQRLGSKALIINHVPTWELLAKIEAEMMKYNCHFFRSGKVSILLEDLAQMFLRKVSEMLTPSSAQSSTANTPVSMN